MADDQDEDPVPTGTVEAVELRDARLQQLDLAAIRYRNAMLAADRASTDLNGALKACDELNRVRPRMVSDQELAERVNRSIPKGTKAFNRGLQMSLMTVRRRLGKAKPK